VKERIELWSAQLRRIKRKFEMKWRRERSIERRN
jgi:hypothetical protein